MSIIYKDDGLTIATATAHWDGTSWPRAGDPASELSWRLRYAEPTRGDILSAAGIVSAYRDLIWKTGRQREDIVRQLRKAEGIAALSPPAAKAGK